MIPYIPTIKEMPPLLDVTSAWQNIPKIIKDIIIRFNINPDTALEFGVERGYSTTAFAHYFKRVIGVDAWDWDMGDGVSRTYSNVCQLLSDWKNITLIQSKYQDFILQNNRRYDLIHVDIGYETHEYQPTYECGDWAMRHSDCVLFHDTLSFPGVKRACEELAEKHGFEFYNYVEEIGIVGIACGLGILIKKI